MVSVSSATWVKRWPKVGRPSAKVSDQVLAVGAVLEAPQADQLQPAAAEAELVIAAELVIIFALLLVERAQPRSDWPGRASEISSALKW